MEINISMFSRPERIVPIAERFGIDPMMTLENIVYARAFSHEQQDGLITTIASKMVNDQFALLIIDSFMSLFRVEFVGREELASRQQAIASLMNKLMKIATEFNIAILITKYVFAETIFHFDFSHQEDVRCLTHICSFAHWC